MDRPSPSTAEYAGLRLSDDDLALIAASIEEGPPKQYESPPLAQRPSLEESVAAAEALAAQIAARRERAEANRNNPEIAKTWLGVNIDPFQDNPSADPSQMSYN